MKTSVVNEQVLGRCEAETGAAAAHVMVTINIDCLTARRQRIARLRTIPAICQLVIRLYCVLHNGIVFFI